jgi:hypothetical protein
VTAVPLAFKVPLVPLVPLVLKAQLGGTFRAYLGSRVQRVPQVFKVPQHGVTMALLVLRERKELLAQQVQQGQPVQQRWQGVLQVLLVILAYRVLLVPQGYVVRLVPQGYVALLVIQVLVLEPREQQALQATLEFRVLLGPRECNQRQYQQR